MPHLPFAAAYPSFAVSVTDSRGAFSSHGHDGAFLRLAPFDPARPPPSKPTSSPPLVYRSAAASNTRIDDPTSPMRVAAAFTGSIGHHAFGVSRVGDGAPNRPPLVRGTGVPDAWVIHTRHPCDETPGPGKYEPAVPKGDAGEHDDFTSYEREKEREGKLRRGATARLGQTSVQPRLADKTPHDITPGPGAYPLSEFSDFETRCRPIGVRNLGGLGRRPQQRSPPSTTNRSVLSDYKESQTIRAATSSFGTAPRSSITGGGPTNLGEFNRFGASYAMPPSGGEYSPLSNQDVVWLSMNRGAAPPPRYRQGKPQGQRFSKMPYQANVCEMSKVR